MDPLSTSRSCGRTPLLTSTACIRAVLSRVWRCPPVAPRQRACSLPPCTAPPCMPATSPATVPHTGTPGLFAHPSAAARPSGGLAAASASRFRVPPLSGSCALVTPDSHSPRLLRSPLSALPAPRLLRSPLSALPACRSVTLQTAACQQQTVDHLLLQRAPPPAGRPEAGQPSAEPKSFGSRKNGGYTTAVLQCTIIIIKSWLNYQNINTEAVRHPRRTVTLA